MKMGKIWFKISDQNSRTRIIYDIIKQQIVLHNKCIVDFQDQINGNI
jgi:hypothetical protein